MKPKKLRNWEIPEQTKPKIAKVNILMSATFSLYYYKCRKYIDFQTTSITDISIHITD